MSLQAARQLLQGLESAAPPPTDVKEYCQVLGSLLDSHEQVSEQARKFNQEAQDAMDLKLSYDVIGGGGSRWPLSCGSNLGIYNQLNSENQQLRHRLQVVQSSRFQQEVTQHFCLGEDRVFFTSNADLSATCNALLCENRQHKDRLCIVEAALQARGPEAEKMAFLQQQVDSADQVARGRFLEDLQTKQYIDDLNWHSHSLVQQIKLLTDSSDQLKLSESILQQQFGQHQPPLQFGQHQPPLQQAGCDATGVTAEFGQPSCKSHSSGTSPMDETTLKPPLSTATGVGDEGRQADDPATPAEGVIPSSATSQAHHGAAFPASSRLTLSSHHVPGVAQAIDSRAEVVAALPTTEPADQPVAEALPFPGPLSASHNEDARQHADHHAAFPDGPAVPIAAYVPWEGIFRNGGDFGLDGWPEDAAAADMGQAAAPAASRPTTYLEAACQAPIPAVKTAARNRQGRSSGRGSAVVREGGAAKSGVHSPQLLAARRPDSVAENGWRTVASKEGSKSAKHSTGGGGNNMHSTAQPAVSGAAGASVRTKAQKKRQAKLRRKALQQSDS